MSTLLLLGHAPWACAMQAVARHAFPDLPDDALLAMDIHAAEQPPAIAERLGKVFSSNQGQELLVLVDVAGATPANVLQDLLLQNPSVKAVAGCNVAMLWRTLSYRELDAASLQARALAGALAAVAPLEPR